MARMQDRRCGHVAREVHESECDVGGTHGVQGWPLARRKVAVWEQATCTAVNRTSVGVLRALVDGPKHGDAQGKVLHDVLDQVVDLLALQLGRLELAVILRTEGPRAGQPVGQLVTQQGNRAFTTECLTQLHQAAAVATSS